MAKSVKLGILASDDHIGKFLVQNFKSIFGNAVEISLFLTKTMSEPISRSMVLLTSHTSLMQDANRLFSDSMIIPGEKILNGYNLEKVIQLPKGKKVLILDAPKSISLEVIENLLDLGIDHLEYVPYDPNEKNAEEMYADIDTAISPGLAHLAPRSITTVIDIGPRMIKPSTFIELLEALGLDNSYMTIYVNQYSNLLLYNARKLADSLDESERLRKEQEIILNEVDDGIISVNRKGIISVVNPSIERIFKIDKRELKGLHIKAFFDQVGLTDKIGFNIKESIENLIFNYKGKSIMCNKIVMYKEADVEFFSFKEVSRIVELEGEIRRKLNSKGHVAKYNFNDIWGDNSSLNQAKEYARNFAKTDMTILLTGESGTGKELFAQAIHTESLRNKEAFIAINFAALPDTLVESELFGYESGAFTGAKKEGKPGLFEQAHGGTIFLDEIGDANLNIQAKLLRVLQEKEIMRVGGDKVIPVNVRIIAATNKDLTKEISQGLFRADLFYRLNVLPIEIPALRTRNDDIMPILEKYLSKMHGTKKIYSPEVRKFLNDYTWPGNVRELYNIADYFHYASHGRERIDIKDIPAYLYKQLQEKDIGTKPEPAVCNHQIIGCEREKSNMSAVLRAFIVLGYENLGRNKLLTEIKKNDPIMTEHKLKNLLKKLNNLGLIRTGNTKQGSSITQKGIEFYNES